MPLESRTVAWWWGAAIGLLAVLPTPLRSEEWQRITSYEGNFVVALPTEPTYTSSKIAVASGPKGEKPSNLQIHRFVAEVDQGRTVLTVLYSDYPQAHVAAQGRQAILERVRDGAVSSVGGEIRREERITLDEHPGLEVTFDGGSLDAEADQQKERVFATFRFYLVGNRLYQVAALQAGQAVPANFLEQLFGSFKLRQPVPDAAPPEDAPEPETAS